jgi:hypothetical protein
MDEKKQKKDVLQGTLALMVLKNAGCARAVARATGSRAVSSRSAETF